MQMNTGNQTGQNRTNTTNDTSVGVFNEKKKLPPHSHAHFFPTDTVYCTSEVELMLRLYPFLCG